MRFSLPVPLPYHRWASIRFKLKLPPKYIMYFIDDGLLMTIKWGTHLLDLAYHLVGCMTSLSLNQYFQMRGILFPTWVEKVSLAGREYFYNYCYLLASTTYRFKSFDSTSFVKNCNLQLFNPLNSRVLRVSEWGKRTGVPCSTGPESWESVGGRNTKYTQTPCTVGLGKKNVECKGLEKFFILSLNAWVIHVEIGSLLNVSVFE